MTNYLYMHIHVYICVCVWEREIERELFVCACAMNICERQSKFYCHLFFGQELESLFDCLFLSICFCACVCERKRACSTIISFGRYIKFVMLNWWKICLTTYLCEHMHVRESTCVCAFGVCEWVKERRGGRIYCSTLLGAHLRTFCNIHSPLVRGEGGRENLLFNPY